MRRPSGFTLIELVIIIIIVGVVVAGLVPTLSTTAKSLSTNETLQQATQYAQECAERAVATRQNLGFADFPSTFNCSNPSGFTRTVTVGGTYVGTTLTPCPNLVTCRDIAITVASGVISSSITTMLADY